MEELAKLEAERGTPGYEDDTGEYDRVPAAIWEREPGGDYCTGDCGDVYQYADGGGVLYGEG